MVGLGGSGFRFGCVVFGFCVGYGLQVYGLITLVFGCYNIIFLLARLLFAAF